MHQLLRIFTCAALLLTSAVCSATETPEQVVAGFTPNQRTLAAIWAEYPDDPAALQKASDAYLAKLEPGQAVEALSGVLRLGRAADILTRKQLAAAMVAAHRRYLPGADISIDYWRYIELIAGKLERKEIDLEEYRYLADRKYMEAARAQQSDEMAAESRRRAAAEAAYRAQAEADADETARNLQMLQSVRQAFRPRAQPPRTVNCLSTPAGAYVTTTCN